MLDLKKFNAIVDAQSCSQLRSGARSRLSCSQPSADHRHCTLTCDPGTHFLYDDVMAGGMMAGEEQFDPQKVIKRLEYRCGTDTEYEWMVKAEENETRSEGDSGVEHGGVPTNGKLPGCTGKNIINDSK